MKRLVLFICIVIGFAVIISPSYVLAAKKRIRKTIVAKGVSYSSARLSRATHSIIVTFQNLANVKKTSYELSYSANGISQGVAGSITPTGATDSRDLYFGTCSHGVCTPHYNITNASLLVRTTLTSGSVYTKRYRIKI